MSTIMPYDIFISFRHPEPDKTCARQLVRDLEAAGYKVAIDERDFRPNQPFLIEMERCVKESRFTVAIVTPRYVESGNTEAEGILVTVRDMRDRERRLIPLVYETTQMPDWMYILTGISSHGSGPICASAQATYGVSRPPSVASSTTHGTPPGRLWNVPYARNPYFTGRDEELKTLRARLLGEGTVAVSQVAAISGLGGIGKTSTAVEYAYRHREDYNAILWVKADSITSLNEGYVALASLLGLPGAESGEPKQLAAAVNRWLEKNAGWLLVLDNADTPDLLGDYLVLQPAGHIILTSRSHQFASLRIPPHITLDKMTHADAVRFLLDRTARNDSDQAERDAIVTLANDMDYLPLALEQAAAYILQTPTTFQNYLTSYRNRPFDLFHKGQPLPRDYPASVATTWVLNFAQIEAESRAAADLLRLSAFLAPDDIPLELLTRGAAELGPELSSSLADAAGDPGILDGLLGRLAKYSLIRLDMSGRSYSIHRLVQVVHQASLDEDEQQMWVERAVRTLRAAFPDVALIANWPDIERLIPHVQACTAFMDRWNLDSVPAARLLNKAGYYLDDRARYQEGEPLYRRALKISEKALGLEHPDVAATLNNLAVLYSNQRRTKEAEPLYERSLKIGEKVLGPEHPDVAQSLNNLASLYRNQGRYQEAEPLYERALKIREKALVLAPGV